MKISRRKFAVRLGFLAAATLLVVSAPAVAEDTMAGSLMVHDAWARPAVGNLATSAAYMTIMNHGKEADRLVEVRADVSDKVELHTSEKDGDIMRMRSVDAIEVPAGGAVSMAPGGYHVMLIGVKAPLEKGSTFPATLVFEKQGEVSVEVSVGAAPEGGIKMGIGGHMHGGGSGSN